MADLKDKVIIPTDWMIPHGHITIGFSKPALFLDDVIEEIDAEIAELQSIESKHQSQGVVGQIDEAEILRDRFRALLDPPESSHHE